MEKPHPAYVHVFSPLICGDLGRVSSFMALFSLSALLHSFIFFPFVSGTFLSPSCLPLLWGQLSGTDAGLSLGARTVAPAGTGTTIGTLLGARVC